MNNEEPINLSHYPDGRKPGKKSSVKTLKYKSILMKSIKSFSRQNARKKATLFEIQNGNCKIIEKETF